MMFGSALLITVPLTIIVSSFPILTFQETYIGSNHSVEATLLMKYFLIL